MVHQNISWTEKFGNFIKHKSILEDQLTKDNIQIQSPPIKATYNSPFTLPIMRRNEAMFRVECKN